LKFSLASYTTEGKLTKAMGSAVMSIRRELYLLELLLEEKKFMFQHYFNQAIRRSTSSA